jgi:MoaA/NifB/PqqE/SkfB family radical SAM enzyme
LENPDKFFNSFLSADKFRGLLEKYNKGNKAEVIFLTGGEPLMHAQFDQFIEISKEYGLKVKISSNGILIKDKLSSIKKLDSINVSVDSYDYDSFKKYRGGTPNQFDKIRQGLRSMKEQGIAFTMSFLLSRTNLSEADAMVTFAQSIGPNGVNFHNINPHGSGEYASLTIQDESTRQFLDRMTRRTDYPFDIILPVIFDTQSPAFLEGQCVQPWYYFCFNSAGNVAFCCHLEHDAKIGNVFSGYDFNSKDMVRFREDIMAKKVGEKCLYCQRRFLGKDYGRFDSTKKQWQIFSY